ncbi:hypothetical protein MNBD_ALPHA08-394 [hydrothermal vent metagenome]|uniref:DUF11 domain-containing protein n=1 Tax=hydrothermal vent metagenome TaxID=652676 RepID=A0A3B0R4F8_9ZZZZ
MQKITLQKAYHPGLAMFVAFLLSMAMSLTIARAQDGAEHGIMSNGDAAVTGFSGTQDQDGQTIINPDGASLKVLDLSQRGSANGQVINAPAKFEAYARDIGQVFGVALDNASPPNIYVTATSAYGLSLVTPDTNGDGVPEKATTGSPEATFMPGQFGLNGGSGSVWKIDGKTGEVSLFASIENSVAGLGNITFDATHYQFFVSDLESGLVHRVDMSGQVVDTFDHGASGRPAGGLDAVENDPSLKADITSPDFDTDNADTWGLADVRRRVWGLTYYNGRLYYSPTQGPQVWSVGINSDGSFADDATIEIQTVPGGFPVSDMLFTTAGQMVLSQRGGQLGSSDYSQFHTPANNSVLRYSRDETGQWIQEPQPYAIGSTPDFKNASGGIGLACANILWSTGDALTGSAADGASQIIHGLQGNNANAVRPANTPPTSSWFVDFDGQFEDAEKAGQVGDVEIYRSCPKQAEAGFDEGFPGGGYEEDWPGWTPEWTPPDGWYPPEWWPRFPDLRLIKKNTRCKYVGRSLIVECKFKMIVTNVGAVVYTGPLSIVDNVPANFKYTPPPGGNIPWFCEQPGGAGSAISCNSADIETLLPGQSKTLLLRMRKFGGKKRRYVRNCSVLEVPDENLLNNEDCGFGKTPPRVRKYCPAGWGRYPNEASVPDGWKIKIVSGLICARPDILIPPPLPGPKCKVNEFRYNNPAAVPPGWSSRTVTLNGRTIWCAKPQIIVPLPGPQCRANETRYNNPAAVPPGWSSRRVVRNGRSIWCAKPRVIIDPRPGPQCRTNERRYNNPAAVPPSWSSRRVVRNGRSIWCAKPRVIIDPRPGPVCKAGERKYRSRADVPARWSSRRVVRNGRSIWCAKPRVIIDPRPGPVCKVGERKYRSRADVPARWRARRVVRNGRSIWCAKPRIVRPGPVCKAGERQFRSRADVPARWRARREVRNGRRIWCAKPRAVICKQGTRKVGNRCVKIPVRVICKQGTRKVGNRCVKIPVRVICKQGTRKVGNRCVKIPVRVICKQGTRKVGNRCVKNPVTITPRPVAPRVIPGLLRCPQGTRPSNGRCVKG